MRNKINIGTASVILIFIILCLSVFSLLSLSDAKSSEVFAERRADSVTAYYRADAEGQRFIKEVSESLQSGRDVSALAQQDESDISAVERDSSDVAAAKRDVSGVATVDRNSRLVYEIPMSSGQALKIELDARDASVLSYYVYNSEDYAIDNSLPVWTGDEEK